MSNTRLAHRSLVAVVLALLAALPATAQAAFPGGNGRIGFERFTFGDPSDAVQLHSIRPSGRAEQPLTQGQDVAYSPDGERIAFAIARPGPDEDGFPPSRALYVADADGSDRTFVVENGFNPSWSPTGRRIAFERPVYEETYFGILMTVKPNGSGIKEVADLASKPSWSPDGRLIAFLGGLGLERVKPDGTGRRQLVPYPEQRPPLSGVFPFLDVDWAPNGRRLAVVRELPTSGSESGKRTDLVAYDRDGDRVGRVLKASRLRSLAFSPDGRRLVYERASADPKDPSTLYQYSLSSEKTVTLTEGSGPSWQPVPAA